MQKLKRIEFDFERKSFKINGEDVSDTEFLSIKFENGEWEVTIETRLYVSGQIKVPDKKGEVVRLYPEKTNFRDCLKAVLKATHDTCEE